MTFYVWSDVTIFKRESPHRFYDETNSEMATKRRKLILLHSAVQLHTAPESRRALESSNSERCRLPLKIPTVGRVYKDSRRLAVKPNTTTLLNSVLPAASAALYCNSTYYRISGSCSSKTRLFSLKVKVKMWTLHLKMRQLMGNLLPWYLWKIFSYVKISASLFDKIITTQEASSTNISGNSWWPIALGQVNIYYIRTCMRKAISERHVHWTYHKKTYPWRRCC